MCCENSLLLRAARIALGLEAHDREHSPIKTYELNKPKAEEEVEERSLVYVRQDSTLRL